MYNDHSMYVWDIHDLKKIGKAWSFLYHSSCVYGVEVRNHHSYKYSVVMNFCVTQILQIKK